MRSSVHKIQAGASTSPLKFLRSNYVQDNKRKNKIIVKLWKCMWIQCKDLDWRSQTYYPALRNGATRFGVRYFLTACVETTQTKCVHNLSMMRHHLHVYLYIQTPADAGDIHTWRMMLSGTVKENDTALSISQKTYLTTLTVIFFFLLFFRYDFCSTGK